MRGRQSPIESLTVLPRIVDAGERKARWRQAVAAIGQHVGVHGPPPLDGMPAEELALSVRSALDFGLVDDMDWIAPGAAAVALYELSAALPAGKERREIGRRVFERLYQGTAETFTPVATRMALGSGKPLEAPTMRARVGLVFALPIGTSVNADPLALTLISRRDLFARWVASAASGPLPSRRLAATLLERACREAVRRAQQGDSHSSELLAGHRVRPTFDQLLADREPLVWRHAAVARGLLSTVSPAIREEIDLALDPSLSPTEWRRAGVSLAACLAADFDTAFSQCRSILDGAIAAKDPGLPATMIWGLGPVVEAEPEAATELLDYISASGRRDVADALGALLGNVANTDFGSATANRVRKRLLDEARGSDPTMQAIVEDTLRALERPAPPNGMRGAVRKALLAYETMGARAAFDLAAEAMERAHSTLDAIEALSVHREAALPEILGPLSDLDESVLERSRLHDLLLLGHRPGDANAVVPEMDRLHDRLATWILTDEERYVEGAYSRGETIARQRRLKALLHLVDLETGRTDSERSDGRARGRLRRAIGSLLRHVALGPDASVHRIYCATLARSFDAAVREGFADPADLLLMVFSQLADNHSVQAMMEASTNPDVQAPLAAYTEFLSTGSRGAEPLSDPPLDVPAHTRTGAIRLAKSFVQLSRGLGTNGSYRGEALRQVVLHLGRALHVIAGARGLSELVETETGRVDPVREVEYQTEALRRLIEGASLRVLKEDVKTGFDIVADVPPLSALVERAATGVPPNPRQLEMSIGELTADLPAAIGAGLRAVLGVIRELPATPSTSLNAIPLKNRRVRLPDWLMPRRTIGGFYVVRALGAGGVSSVFMARRIEERHDANAELYALKVPVYDPDTARSLTEQEFLQMFRDEAGALLALPQHEHLARFVTFDAAAKPKPILVMELIQGFSLDRLIRNRSLSVSSVLKYLDGILSGLSAMHAAGVGHLDVKPSNVILRDNQRPVLVDFGLSGRQLRPGCGTLEYCAPEVLGVFPEGARPTAQAADLYSFACTAFELLTGELMIDADDEITLMTQHIQHDGWPDKLADFAAGPGLADLGVVLAACLRHDPGARPTAQQTRRALTQATQSLTGHPWPLGTAVPAQDLTA